MARAVYGRGTAQTGGSARTGGAQAGDDNGPARPEAHRRRQDRSEQFRRERHDRYDERMESSGFGDLFGDPEELQRRIAQFAEQMQGQQSLAWADNAIKLAVDMTVAAVNRVNVQGDAEAQAQQIRSVIAVVFPEAVTLVREARAGLQ
jgi:hypothetical protein